MQAHSRALDPQPKTENANVGLDAKTSQEIAAGLGTILSSTYALLIKTHVHHWNVVGPLFYQLHLLLETQYQDLFEATDTLAERMRALGAMAPFPEIKKPSGVEKMSAENLVEDLIADNQALCRVMRELAVHAEDSKDIVTHDMLVARLTVQEKAIWMLRSIIAN